MTVLSSAIALHRAWSGAMARGMAMVSVEDPELDELGAQLEKLRAQTGEQAELRLGPDGLEALSTVIHETLETLRSYRQAGSRSQGQGLLGMLEDHLGEGLPDPNVSRKVMDQLEALSRRIGVESD